MTPEHEQLIDTMLEAEVRHLVALAEARLAYAGKGDSMWRVDAAAWSNDQAVSDTYIQWKRAKAQLARYLDEAL